MAKNGKLLRKTAFLAALTVLLGVCAQPGVLAQQKNKTLQGGVSATGRTGGNTLSRTKDVKNNNNDPFNGAEETLDAPRNSFEPEAPVRPPKAQRPLQGNVDQGGPPPPMQQQNPFTAPPEMGADPDAIPAQQQLPQQQPAYNPNDPDSSPDMQLAWDLWHKRVAGAIFERFNFFAKAAFKFSPPLMAKLSYGVTRDGRITNINVDQKSSNVLFNVLVVQCVKSLDGDIGILQYPQGSRRQFVQKYGTFAQNFGGQAGFRYTVGDMEKIRQQQMMMQQQMMQR